MNYRCPKCQSLKNKKHGQYTRKSDSKIVYRFKCNECFSTFSNASFSTCYRQHKRRVNPILEGLLSSGVSQRRAAILLKVTRRTVARKLRFLATLARMSHSEMLKELDQDELSHLQFDDLITSHHTKLKPLSLGYGNTFAKNKNSCFRIAEDQDKLICDGHLLRPYISVLFRDVLRLSLVGRRSIGSNNEDRFDTQLGVGLQYTNHRPSDSLISLIRVNKQIIIKLLML